MLVVIQFIAEASHELFLAPCLIHLETSAKVGASNALAGGGIRSSSVLIMLRYS